MNKLREQIVKLIAHCPEEECPPVDCEICKADAILALLEPRLLTKDEAHVANNIWKCGEYCISCDYQDDCRDLNAKLELIQEEDSE